jgi:hypothetical protein
VTSSGSPSPCKLHLAPLSIKLQLTDHSKEPLKELKGATVAVHATYYLQTLLSKPPSSEPLLSAIGGTPLALKQHIENDLKQWEEHGIHPKFFFDGQAVVGRPEMAMREAKETLIKNEAAWAPYYNHKAEEAVVGFGKTGMRFLLLGQVSS